jgi:hypothetical protein
MSHKSIILDSKGILNAFWVFSNDFKKREIGKDRAWMGQVDFSGGAWVRGDIKNSNNLRLIGNYCY